MQHNQEITWSFVFLYPKGLYKNEPMRHLMHIVVEGLCVSGLKCILNVFRLNCFYSLSFHYLLSLKSSAIYTKGNTCQLLNK